MQTYLSIRSERNASTTAVNASILAWTSEKIPIRITACRSYQSYRAWGRSGLNQIGIVEVDLDIGGLLFQEVRFVQQLHRAGGVERLELRGGRLGQPLPEGLEEPAGERAVDRDVAARAVPARAHPHVVLGGRCVQLERVLGHRRDHA